MMNKLKSTMYDPFLPTLLISMHGEYVQQILQGQKIIEYRKRFFKDSFQAFVYTTGSRGGIQLFLKCSPAISSDAATLAKIGQVIQGDEYTEIYDYFKEKDEGCIIPIVETCEIAKVSLAQLRSLEPAITMPQNYLFLERPEKKKIFDFLINQSCQNKQVHDWAERFKQIQQVVQPRSR
ncbi:hypothetical protein [Lactobacillus xylocopicola]|uniref:ASCH domain-containing protein n=1 Tax=Lactobacillus xylocopicola TaxID=2976676 RepID=A0ABM8BFA2_9LACO|nr:hypothetical protein [Lactobacillus xylocopicola]BDR59893.1 hypothetical protein KIM322_01540 [Lactobacillus xylocopicola]